MQLRLLSLFSGRCLADDVSTLGLTQSAKRRFPAGSLLAAAFLLACWPCAARAASFVQVVASTPQSPQSTLTIRYAKAETAGDLNIVVVGWNDTTAAVQSVQDSAGNLYRLAIGPTTANGLEQSIYYAPQIAGGSNTVTVKFSRAAVYPDVRILEYSGYSALDVVAASQGSGSSSATGAATTTTANELIFGANTVKTAVNRAGSGFTARIITSDGDLAEDKTVSVVGSNSVKASLDSPGAWVMQMATFSAGNGSVQSALSALSCASSSETGAASDVCTVILTAAAPSGGLAVSLASNNSAVTVPASVTVPAGSITASFTATTAAVTSAQTATLTASAGGVSRTFAISLTSAPAALSALSCASSSETGAASDVCTVTLTTAAPSGGLAVSLASNNSAVTVPASVTVPAGSITASFTATTAAVTSAQTATLTASAGGTSNSFALQLKAYVATLSVSGSSIAFGNVSLNTPATQPVTLTASGTAPVTVSNGTLSGTGFSMSGISYPLTLQAGQAATIEVTFDPSAAGAATGAVTLNSNCSMGAMAIGLTGTGTAATYSVDLSWNAPTSSPDPVAGYRIYRATNGGSYQLLNSSLNASTSFTDSSVSAGSSYDYEVTSVDADGNESTPSNIYAPAIP
ncbi:MAG TPA: choice-of-anchor D domain-containing protein [Acidobacteriaceae bacterium]|nr:choice-of-anchor D domain-containing protein [Acidobacteriaceae bacterium]